MKQTAIEVSVALGLWKQDVLRLLVFQWCLLITLISLSAIAGFNVALNTGVAACSVLIPNTALGAWIGLRLLLGNVDSAGVLLASFLKTILSATLIVAAFVFLQDYGWVWHGFFAGLFSMVFAPVVFGLVFGQKV